MEVPRRSKRGPFRMRKWQLPQWLYLKITACVHNEEQLVDINDRPTRPLMQIALASMDQILSPFILPARYLTNNLGAYHLGWHVARRPAGVKRPITISRSWNCYRAIFSALFKTQCVNSTLAEKTMFLLFLVRKKNSQNVFFSSIFYAFGFPFQVAQSYIQNTVQHFWHISRDRRFLWWL